MHWSVERNITKPVDTIQQRITRFAHDLNYGDLSPEAIHAAKVRVIDTLGALVSGFFAEPCCIARNFAAKRPDAFGATVIGTRLKTAPEMAAFTNATTARYVELTDSYHWPGSYGGHPSDVVTPVLAIAEHVHANGQELISAIVIAYEVYLRISDVVHHYDIDHTNFSCLGSAMGAGKLLKLSSEQLSHCIAMAAVPNVVLRQVRGGQRSMYKATASGQAGRAGIFAALLARAGMEGPHLPFEGKAGWCDHVARERFSLNDFGGKNVRFKILDTFIKNRACGGLTISSVLAAEKIAPLKNVQDVQRIIVEVNKQAKKQTGTEDERWSPASKETADASTPYTVAATLLDGTLTPRSYNDAHFWHPDLRALMKKIEVEENEEFTKGYQRVPVEHHARVTVVTGSGERLVGNAGGDDDDMGVSKTDSQISDKFRELTEDVLGAKRVNTILERLWQLEGIANVGEIPAAFTFC